MNSFLPPLSVLSVCTGNICRSPMAERLLDARLAEVFGDRTADFVLSHSAGTGTWHVGEEMNPPAARQVHARGGDAAGFGARGLLAAHVEASDLILTATRDQASFVASLRPDAAPRTFVYGEFGRLLRDVDPAVLPPHEPTPAAVHARGVAIVAAADKARSGAVAEPGDELDDPFGMSERFFGRIAEEIEAVVRPFVALLAAHRLAS